MKKFHFSMEKILSIRQFKEQEAKLELGKKVSHCDALDAQLYQLAHCYKDALHSFAPQPGAVYDAGEIAYQQNYLSLMQMQKQQLIEQRLSAELAVQEARAVYIKAHQDCLVLEKLQEKRFAQWKKAVLKEQEDIVDDSITAGYQKKR